MYRMNRNVCLILLAVLCIVVTAQAQQLKKEGRFWVGEIEKTFEVQKGGTLVMEDINGDVTVRVWDKNQVHIREIKKMDIYTKTEAEAAMEESESGYSKQGNTVHVGGAGFSRRWIQSRFTVTVPADFSCDIETEGGALDLRGMQGNVDANSGGGEITLYDIGGVVDARTGGGSIEINKTTNKVSARTGGGEVEVSDTEGAVRVSTGGGEVTVRNTKDEVRASTGGGEVTVIGTQGDVDVSTGGGDVEIEDAGGDVSVSTGGGEIKIRNIDGDFNASTGGGAIEAETVKGTLEISTGGGDIELEDIQGSIEVSTGGGDVKAEITLRDFSIAHDMEISTGGGDIDLTIPSKLPATIDAEIRYRYNSWEDYEITSDFPLKITQDEVERRYKTIRATGDINGGGDLIRLKTGGGNINIRKGK